MEMPKSMDECVYFTRRNINSGKVVAWVKRQLCPKCKKDYMTKPKDPKTGKYKVRAKEYVCSECGYTVEKGEYEETLTFEAQYTCPHCSKEGEVSIPFKRKKIQVLDEETGKKSAVDAIRFQCEHCGKNIDVTKKMK